MLVRASILAAGCCAVLVGACGGTSGQAGPSVSASTSGAGTSTSDACSLVTKSDAETTLGEPAGPPKPRSTSISSGCVYVSLSGSARLDVAIFHYADAATAISKYQEFSNIGQPVSGLGDQARGNTGYLAVQKGSVLFTMSMPVSPKQADPFGAMKSLAKRVIAQL